jgi:hypothetical protein
LGVSEETAAVERSKRVGGSAAARGWRLVDRCVDYLETDVGGATVVIAAMAASVALSLYLTRGTTFWFDEFTLYSASHGYSITSLLSEHNGQLILVPRFIYATIFKLFGADYLVVRVVEAVGVAMVGATVYALARPRIGALALAPAILLMFFGSAWESTLTGNGIINVYCLLPGLAAMLALERRWRYSDPLACILLALSLASWSAGLGFVAGAAVIVLRSGDRLRRAWVFALPLVLWALWWLIKPGFHGALWGGVGPVKASNALLIWNFSADSAAAIAGAATGLNYNFSNPLASALSNEPWGPSLVIIAVAGLAVALRRRALTDWPWAWFAVLLTLWGSFAMASFILRPPSAGRYVYVGAAVAILVAAGALTGLRATRRVAVAVLAGLIFALGANIAQLRDGSRQLRAYATQVRADLAAVEITRYDVSPSFVPSVGPLDNAFLAATAQAGTYLAAVNRNGSFSDTLAELRAAPEQAREEADQVLAQALGLRLTAISAPASNSGCRKLHATSPGVAFRVPRRGARIRAPKGSRFSLRRFGAAYSVELGKARSPWSGLRIPRDLAPDPWWARVATAHPIGICPL